MKGGVYSFSRDSEEFFGIPDYAKSFIKLQETLDPTSLEELY
jgi:hypothetical protein